MQAHAVNTQLYEAIPKLLTSLPEEHAAQLVAAKQNVDAAAREAKAADAAVQAVSQVRAATQATGTGQCNSNWVIAGCKSCC